VFGVRVSLLIGITAAGIAAVVGTVLGAIAGYAGGIVDEAISKLTDIFLMIPAFFLVILVVAMWGNSLIYMMIIIGLTNWPANARLMRAQALSLKQRTFTRAAVALGDSHLRILLRHIMPHGLFPIIANTTLQVAAAVLTEASLSFIGLGDPNVISWGKMIYDGRSVMQIAWWSTVFPGLAIVVTVMAFYFLGDGLNVALNPKLQGRAAS
jgi:peptide/nickel transport system permease protein